jgi:hypothetical protein
MSFLHARRLVVHSAFVLVIVGAFSGCHREEHPTAAETKAMRDKMVGTYSLTEEQRKSFTGMRPRIVLSPDGRFSITGTSTDDSWDLGFPPETSLSIEGNWSVGDDGDGSWAVFFDTVTVNGRQIRKRLFGSPALTPQVGMVVKTDRASFFIERTEAGVESGRQTGREPFNPASTEPVAPPPPDAVSCRRDASAEALHTPGRMRRRCFPGFVRWLANKP